MYKFLYVFPNIHEIIKLKAKIVIILQWIQTEVVETLIHGYPKCLQSTVRIRRRMKLVGTILQMSCKKFQKKLNRSTILNTYN